MQPQTIVTGSLHTQNDQAVLLAARREKIARDKFLMLIDTDSIPADEQLSAMWLDPDYQSNEIDPDAEPRWQDEQIPY